MVVVGLGQAGTLLLLLSLLPGLRMECRCLCGAVYRPPDAVRVDPHSCAVEVHAA